MTNPVMRARAKNVLTKFSKEFQSAFGSALRLSLNSDEDQQEAAGTQLVDLAYKETKAAVPTLLFVMGAQAAVIRGAFFQSWLSRYWKEVVAFAKLFDLKLHRLLRAARFKIPEYLPETLTIYRGTHCGLYQSIKGNSWTTDRAAAAYIATSYQHDPNLARHFPDMPSMLVKRTIARSAILFYAPENQFGSGFDEIIHDSKPAGKKDGTRDEWIRLGGAFFRSRFLIPGSVVLKFLHVNAREAAELFGEQYQEPEIPEMTVEDWSILDEDYLNRVAIAAERAPSRLISRAEELYGSVENMEYAFHEAKLAGAIY